MMDGVSYPEGRFHLNVSTFDPRFLPTLYFWIGLKFKLS